MHVGYLKVIESLELSDTALPFEIGTVHLVHWELQMKSKEDIKKLQIFSFIRAQFMGTSWVTNIYFVSLNNNKVWDRGGTRIFWGNKYIFYLTQ